VKYVRPVCKNTLNHGQYELKTDTPAIQPWATVHSNFGFSTLFSFSSSKPAHDWRRNSWTGTTHKSHWDCQDRYEKFYSEWTEHYDTKTENKEDKWLTQV